MNKPIIISHPNKAQMIAHRGLSGIETENTAAAFVAAGQHPYFGIETDVHRTRDGQFVIIHDDTPFVYPGITWWWRKRILMFFAHCT